MEQQYPPGVRLGEIYFITLTGNGPSLTTPGGIPVDCSEGLWFKFSGLTPQQIRQYHASSSAPHGRIYLRKIGGPAVQLDGAVWVRLRDLVGIGITVELVREQILPEFLAAAD